ncbi:hypothetical protein [Lacticaseibacillus brantae]|uniref:Uncharacterized protein n=1 Tax=Lacticaseibacillus brantae DSM 23927 TaxID=1423727 RepID=A0A0R2B6N4_9LACO|nr:hypothetical protein [Lacticaseibacillus brantae]KRM71750.1 hypothetical protein FC34_GL001409 [Lacticaseibacillus brantae DSM 23927]
MDEIIFFNPGDALASNYDYQEARRSAEIYKVDHAVDEGLVVARDANGQFAVFYEAAGDPKVTAVSDPQKVGKYTILAHL